MDQYKNIFLIIPKYFFTIFISLSFGFIGNSAYASSIDSSSEDVLSHLILADEDGDGVEDEDDTCPGTPLGETVDTLGCSESQLDNDNDGVTNNLDLCPQTVLGIQVDTTGCAIVFDADNDGVIDSQDLCPDTPLGETVDTLGCSESQLDNDNDGVTNNKDTCPETVLGAQVDVNGCISNLGPGTGDGGNPNTGSTTSTGTGSGGDNPNTGTTTNTGPDSGDGANPNTGTATNTGPGSGDAGNPNTGTATQSCFIDLSLSSGPQFQTVKVGEPIANVTYKFQSDCIGSNLGESIKIIGLPTGINWEGQGSGIVLSGLADATPGNYPYTIFIDNSSGITANEPVTQAFIDGEIVVLRSENNGNGLPAGPALGNNYITENGCEITILNLPASGIIKNVCSTEPFNEQVVVSTTCSNSIISGQVIGLPPGWTTSSSLDANNNAILTLVSGPENIEGTYDLNFIITDSSNNFKNETSITFEISADCGDIDVGGGNGQGDGNGLGEGIPSDLNDLDNDGVPNEFDLCPKTKRGSSIDAFGCSRDQSFSNNIVDSDSDGISDAFDGCPDTPLGSPINEFGCSDVQVGGSDSIADDDSDGIPNFIDLCPDTLEAMKVDAFGCSVNESPIAGTFIDTDLDGVPDEFDECPATKTGDRVDYFGCAKKQIPGGSVSDDDDNDGVPNLSDICPNTAAGVSVDFFGCGVDQVTVEGNLDDSDNDGVPDFYDACPDSATGEKINTFGCAKGQIPLEGSILDTDKDGIPDAFDVCPDTLEGTLANQFGCSAEQNPEKGSFNDTDSDGIPDDFDACPDTLLGEIVNEFGCLIDESQQNKTFIPDNAFEQKLIDLGYDDLIDNFVETERIQSIQDLNLSGGNINDLAGIESFTALTQLNVSRNNLFNINISNNQALTSLVVDDNFISRISISNNPGLQYLSIKNNQLSGINISQNSSLSNLNIGNNMIYFIDLMNNSNLTTLRLNSTPIQSIDVSTLTSLGVLEVINTDISCISVSEGQLAQIPQGWKINGVAFYSINCGFLNESDNDNDGVLNELDLCPSTPNGQRVNESGCSRTDSDKDLDGVPDQFDLCPGTPENAKVNEFGCIATQIDVDLDGVLNEFDQCPDSPVGIAVNVFGCSEKEEKKFKENDDDDRDGIINSLDRCPETAAGTVVDEFGCTPTETIEQFVTDNDLDGVLNIDDLCPDTPSGLPVNSFGCPLNILDSDYDKITDDIDLCPNTPSGEEVDEYGCSLSQKENDTDLDGVVNSKDYCPNTPPFTIVNSNGCSVAQIAIDSDSDGVNNSDDQCPNTKPLESVNENGCSITQQDDDQDGVVNALDRCIATPVGQKVNEYGCTLVQIDGDDDQDGVLNSVDKCPGTPVGAVVDEKGCPFFAPVILSQTFEKTENSRDSITSNIRVYLGKIIISDPNASVAGDISKINLEIISGEDSTLFELQNDSIFLVDRTDFETKSKHFFQIRATNDKNLFAIGNMELIVLNIANASLNVPFNVSVNDVDANTTADTKNSYRRYFNPNTTKGVGKWKIKKKISGGADAALFSIGSSGDQQKNGSGESEDYLEFINPPDFDNPQDHNGDNIYEVEVVNINTNDGESASPLSVTQNNLVVPEGSAKAIQLQTISVSPLDDTDGDGIVDILDNSPLVSNPDQSDADGDGVGDVTDDADHDGVWNPRDDCADTPFGSRVNKEGCLIFYLAPSNFSLSKTEKCLDTNSISLVVQDISVTYNIAVSGAVNKTETLNTNNWTLNNLSSGDYSICVTIEGILATEFMRCFDLTINEPQPLSVYSASRKGQETVNYKLAGGSSYSITHNGITKQTTQSDYTPTLDKGVNTVSISTGIACQGIFEQAYFNSDTVVTAPNPFNDMLAIYVGGEEMDASIELYSNDGRIITSQHYSLTIMDRTLYIDTSDLITGSYVVKVTNASVNQSQIVIKE